MVTMFGLRRGLPRVSRSQAAAPFTPLSLGSKLLWLIDPNDSGTVVSGGRVDSIPDASGNTSGAAQTGSARLLDGSATFPSGSRRFVRADGQSVWMPVGSTADTARMTTGYGRLYMVMRLSGVASFNASRQFSGACPSNGVVNTGFILLFQQSAATSWRFSVGNGTNNLTGTAFTMSAPTFGTWTCARFTNRVNPSALTGSLVMHRDGTLMGTRAQAALPAAAGSAPFALGGAGVSLGAATSVAFVDIAYAFHTTDDLTAQEETDLSAYINGLFGMGA